MRTSLPEETYFYSDRGVFLRRNAPDVNTPAELAIRNAIIEVKKLGNDPFLDQLVLKLALACDGVADYVEGKTS